MTKTKYLILKEHSPKYNLRQESLRGTKRCIFAFIFTEYKGIKEISLTKDKELMKKTVIFDGRNCYGLEETEEAGVE